MNRQQLGTKLTLDALDVPLDLGTFDGRLTIQKSTYLAAAAGSDCGYYFRWYLRGPYSPELTRDAFSIKADVDGGLDESSRWVFDDAALQRLDKARKLIPARGTPDRARKLELLASVHFLVDRRQVPRADAKPITGLLRKYNKDYSEEEVAEALTELRRHEVLPA
ncbi:MAG: hypothetical protein PVJ57_01090 [Phycisphaerae bacterium]|jgi:uncharacterized protein YwgA